MRRSFLKPFLLAAGAALVAGCRLVQVSVLAVAAAVGLAGYAVYKTGDAAVTGVGKAGQAVASGTRSVATVVYVNGDLKVEHPFPVPTVWLAAGLALRKAGFDDVKGTYDALSGGLTAKTRERVEIALKMRSVESRATELRIRVGTKGDLKTAELINGLIQRELPAPAAAAPAIPTASAAQEEKR